MDKEWCWAPERGLPAPDVVIFLELSAAAAQARGGYGDELYEKVEFQSKVAAAFKSLRTDSWRVRRTASFSHTSSYLLSSEHHET